MKAVAYFWSWFVEYNVKFKVFRSLPRKEQNHYSFWMKWHLHFYAPGLDYIIIYPQNANDKIKLIITAHGDSQYYGKVEEVVSITPQLKDWDITAFIPPYKNLDILKTGMDRPYVFDDLSIKISDVRCKPMPDTRLKKIHLVLYIDHYNLRSNNKNLLQLLLLMLQDLLGEKSFYQNIDVVYVKDISAAAAECLVHLHDLQNYIEVNSFS